MGSGRDCRNQWNEVNLTAYVIHGIITFRGKMVWERGPGNSNWCAMPRAFVALETADLMLTAVTKKCFSWNVRCSSQHSRCENYQAGKLSSNWDHQRLACLRLPIKGKDIPDRLNWHHIDRHYDLNASSNVKMSPKEFCDRIIHSFVFVPSIGSDETIKSFYFTSDTMRRHAIWLIDLADVADLMTTTGKDYPSSGHWVRRADGQLDTWSGHGEPPAGWTNATASKRKT